MRIAAGMVAVLSVLLALGCRGGGEDAPATPATPAGTEYPLTITDMLGREVTIAAAPTRIAALSQTTIDYVYALGAESIVRRSNVTEPVQVQTLPVVDPEPGLITAALIAEQNPDLIVLDRSQIELSAELEPLGVPMLVVGADTFADVPQAMRLLGSALNVPARGEAAASALDSKLRTTQDALPADGPNVLVLTGLPEEPFASTGDTYISDLLTLLGATNLAGDEPSGEFPGYASIDAPAIATLAPDVILLMTNGLAAGAESIGDVLRSDPSLGDIPAIRDERIQEIDRFVFLQAPGPRVGEALDVLSKLLYPDIFAN